MEQLKTSFAFTSAISQTNFLGLMTHTDWFSNPLVLRKLLNVPKEMHPACVLPVLYKVQGKMPELFALLKEMTFAEKVKLIQRSGCCNYSKAFWDEYAEIEKDLLEFLVAEHPEVFGDITDPKQVLKINLNYADTGKLEAAGLPQQLLHYGIVPMVLVGQHILVSKDSGYYQSETDLLETLDLHLHDKKGDTSKDKHMEEYQLENLRVLSGVSDASDVMLFKALDHLATVEHLYVIEALYEEGDTPAEKREAEADSQCRLVGRAVPKGIKKSLTHFGIGYKNVHHALKIEELSTEADLYIHGKEAEPNVYNYELGISFKLKRNSNFGRLFQFPDLNYDATKKARATKTRKIEKDLQRIAGKGIVVRLETDWDINFYYTVKTWTVQAHLTSFCWAMPNGKDDNRYEGGE